MSTTVTSMPRESDDYTRYRSLSLWSVASLLAGIISLPALILPGLLIVPFAGLFLAWSALRQIRRAPNEWSGRGISIAGLVLCLLSLGVGSTVATVNYYVEVPDGYRRLSFAELKPPREERHQQIPSAILPLDGQRVFVKGYVLASDRSSDLKHFILVPDMGTCCFGGQPKLTDMIEVTLEDPLRVRYSWQRRKLAGTLLIDPRPKPEDGSAGGHYKLVADYLR